MPLFLFPLSQRHTDSTLRRARDRQRGPFTLRSVVDAGGDVGAHGTCKPKWKYDDALSSEDACYQAQMRGLGSRPAGSTLSAPRCARPSKRPAAADVFQQQSAGPADDRLELNLFATGGASTIRFEDAIHFPVRIAPRTRCASPDGGAGHTDVKHVDLATVAWSSTCLALIKRNANRAFLQQASFNDAKHENRMLLRSLSARMRKLRALTSQPVAADLTYAKLLRQAVESDGQSSPLHERLRGLVYGILADGLLFFYCPATGKRHVQLMGPAGAGISELSGDGPSAAAPSDARFSLPDDHKLAGAMQSWLGTLVAGGGTQRPPASALSTMRSTFGILKTLFFSVSDGDGTVESDSRAPSPPPSPAHSHSSPRRASGVTLVCSKAIGTLCWETIMRGAGDNVGITRALCLMSVLSAASQAPEVAVTAADAAPSLFGFTTGREGRSKQAMEKARKRELVDCTLSMLHQTGIAPLRARRLCPHPARPAAGRVPCVPPPCRTTATVPGPWSHAALWPFHSQLLPHGQTAARRELEDVAFFDVSHAENHRTLLSWLDSCTTLFPVCLLSFADLCVMSEATLALLAWRPDCVLVFAQASGLRHVARSLAAAKEHAQQQGGMHPENFRRILTNAVSNARSQSHSVVVYNL